MSAVVGVQMVEVAGDGYLPTQLRSAFAEGAVIEPVRFANMWNTPPASCGQMTHHVSVLLAIATKTLMAAKYAPILILGPLVDGELDLIQRATGMPVDIVSLVLSREAVTAKYLRIRDHIRHTLLKTSDRLARERAKQKLTRLSLETLLQQNERIASSQQTATSRIDASEHSAESLATLLRDFVAAQAQQAT